MSSIHSCESSCASAQKAVKVDSARLYLGNVASSLENSQSAVVTLPSEPPKLLCSYLYLLRDEADKKKSTFGSTFRLFLSSEETLHNSESGSKVKLSLGAHCLHLTSMLMAWCIHTRAQQTILIWNRLPRAVIMAPSLPEFKNSLDNALNYVV